MARTDTLGHFLTDVADAIRTKKGTSSTITASDFDTEIASIPSGGGGAVEEKDVNFYDYDGTIVASYTASEFANLTALPDNPTHTGLTAQGWNWTLSDAKDYVGTYGFLDIGQSYVTDDNKHRIYFTLPDKSLSPYLGVGINGTMTVDWGDGTTPEQITGTNVNNPVKVQHIYPNAGDYVITITSETTVNFIGSAYQGSSLLYAKAQSPWEKNRSYQFSITKVELGSNYNLGTNAFNYCYNLKSINIPYTNSANNKKGQDMFNNCKSIKCIIMPKDFIMPSTNAMFDEISGLEIISLPKKSSTQVGNYGSNMFYNCLNIKRIATNETTLGSASNGIFKNCKLLRKVAIPTTWAYIPNEAFSACHNLETLILPNIITEIGISAINECISLTKIKMPSALTKMYGINKCYNLKEIDFTSSLAVPTLATTMTQLPSDCKIIVPDSLYDEWVAATNWSNYADNIVRESEWND